MVEKHGGYLQFYHPSTKQILRIAMNSHYYIPRNYNKETYSNKLKKK